MKRALLLAAVVACKADDPAETPDGAPRPDAFVPDAGPDGAPVDGGTRCAPVEGDYVPGADDDWPVCISDDNLYHPFDASISTVARVAAFEEIASLLFTGATPSPGDFLDARVAYNLSEGLASRLQRREDEHYPPATWMGTTYTCQQILALPDADAALAANAERCVGPAKLSPLIEAEFAVGQDGASSDGARRTAAVRIEAALLWFLYVSNHKEAITCTNVPRDCDSSFAYYTGGEPRETGRGLARHVRGLDLATHDRVWDGILAVRCWRDLDNPGGVATDLALRDRAVTQMDRAALRGIALIIRDRAANVADRELVRILGEYLDRDATQRDAALAAELRAAIDDMNAADVVAALDSLYPCP